LAGKKRVWGSCYESEAALSIVLNYGHNEANETEAAVMHHALARP
jgi:hypothetical protein